MVEFALPFIISTRIVALWHVFISFGMGPRDDGRWGDLELELEYGDLK